MPDSLDELQDGGVLDLGPGFGTIDETINMNGPYSLLNHTTYNVSVVHELDGLYDKLITIPEIAAEDAGGILWVLMTSGFFHRVRVSATEDKQKYHLKFIESTMVYQGQLS